MHAVHIFKSFFSIRIYTIPATHTAETDREAERQRGRSKYLKVFSHFYLIFSLVCVSSVWDSSFDGKFGARHSICVASVCSLVKCFKAKCSIKVFYSHAVSSLQNNHNE